MLHKEKQVPRCLLPSESSINSIMQELLSFTGEPGVWWPRGNAHCRQYFSSNYCNPQMDEVLSVQQWKDRQGSVLAKTDYKHRSKWLDSLGNWMFHKEDKIGCLDEEFQRLDSQLRLRWWKKRAAWWETYSSFPTIWVEGQENTNVFRWGPCLSNLRFRFGLDERRR